MLSCCAGLELGATALLHSTHGRDHVSCPAPRRRDSGLRRCGAAGGGKGMAGSAWQGRGAARGSVRSPRAGSVGGGVLRRGEARDSGQRWGPHGGTVELGRWGLAVHARGGREASPCACVSWRQLLHYRRRGPPSILEGGRRSTDMQEPHLRHQGIDSVLPLSRLRPVRCRAGFGASRIHRRTRWRSLHMEGSPALVHRDGSPGACLRLAHVRGWSAWHALSHYGRQGRHGRRVAHKSGRGGPFACGANGMG